MKTINANPPSAVDFFRQEIREETTKNLNFDYLNGAIETWWIKNQNTHIHELKNQLINIFSTYLRAEDSYFFDKVGRAHDGVAAVCIKNIFHLDSPGLALVVHEALSDLFHLIDIKYDYEEHKAIYLKPSAEKYREWGNGYGNITPHSDDLYEDLRVDFLALTVCRDATNTPTAYYFPADLLCKLDDQDIHTLLSMQALFVSGKNVNGSKERIRNIVEYDDVYGYQFSLDFRIDPRSGERMRAVNGGQHVLDKIRALLPTARHSVSTAETGTFLIVANHKILHARPTLNMTENEVRAQTSTSTLSTTPRLLFRSKGPRKQYYPLNESNCPQETC